MTWFAFVSLLLCSGLCASATPGVKIRVSKKGIDYGNSLAKDLLHKEIRAMSIPNQYARDGKFSFSLKSFRVKSVSYPHSSVSLKPDHNGLTWAITNFGIKIHVDYQAIYRGWWKISNSGWIQASASGVNIYETVSFGWDTGSGRPTIRHKSCWASINDIDVRFRGRWGFVINWFKNKIERDVKKELTETICKKAAAVVNTSAKRSLENMDVTSTVANRYYVDYSLVDTPKVASNYIEVWDKGAVYSRSYKRYPPGSPQSMYSSADNGKMVNLWIEEHSFNSLLYQAYMNGHLKYQVKTNDISSSSSPFSLETSCSGNCIGNLIPPIGFMYPDSTVEISFGTSAVPKVTLTTNKMTITASTRVEFKARSSSYQLSDTASMNMNVAIIFVPGMNSGTLNGKITLQSLQLSDLKLTNNTVMDIPDIVTEGMTTIIKLLVIPQLNVMAARGVKLPVPDKLHFTYPRINVKQGHMLISTDVMKSW